VVWVVSRVGSGIGALDEGPLPKGKGRFWEFFFRIGLNGVFECIFKQKCIRLVHEKLTIFPYQHFINGIVTYSSFLKYTLLRELAFTSNLLKCNSDFMKKSRLAATV